jgi:acetyl-CoA synthetase
MNTDLRLALSCVTHHKEVIQVMETLEASFAKFPNFKTDNDAQVLLWLELVSVFTLNRHKGWGCNFKIHRLLYQYVYHGRDKKVGPPIVWRPTVNVINNSNVVKIMRQLGFNNYQNFHNFSVIKKDQFWRAIVDELQIRFQHKPTQIVEITPEKPKWLAGASMNIVDSCFSKVPGSSIAIRFATETNSKLIQNVTYNELDEMVSQVANGLVAMKFKEGDAISVMLPMTVEAVALYLGIIKAGMVVVSVADSFAAAEIEKRNTISGARGFFCVDSYVRAGKETNIYSKVVEAHAPRAIVISMGLNPPALRQGDILWKDFLSPKKTSSSVYVDPDTFINILFSSGTTGDPKAIPWVQSTPIKCASDGMLHHDIHTGDVVCWPTNLGWMMGPWLIFASLLNGASIALYYGAPTGRGFGEFVKDASVTMLGVIPTIIKNWKSSKCMDGLSWPSIRAFSSTGECSYANDFLWLMSLANYQAPVIEYCGGTEIGGGYLTGTVIHDASLSTFTTPALGLDFVILDETDQEVEPGQEGEVFLSSPSIGLSTLLLNRDHHKVYFKDTPSLKNHENLRRHGDHITLLHNGYYKALGRVDDTMNLGGIKISSAELERTMGLDEDVIEVAAIGIPNRKGGDNLIAFVVLKPDSVVTASKLEYGLQILINKFLNPLFKLRKVVVLTELPKTASNKIMRKDLRDMWMQNGVQPKPVQGNAKL